MPSDWQSRWIEFVDGVSGDLAGFILHDSAFEQGLMRCLARCRPLNKHDQILAEMSDQGVEAELELHLATTVQTASQNTAYSSSGTSRRDGKDGHLHCMDAHGLRVSAAFDVRALHDTSSNLLRSNPHTPRGPTLSELASVSGRGV